MKKMDPVPAAGIVLYMAYILSKPVSCTKLLFISQGVFATASMSGFMGRTPDIANRLPLIVFGTIMLAHTLSASCRGRTVLAPHTHFLIFAASHLLLLASEIRFPQSDLKPLLIAVAFMRVLVGSYFERELLRKQLDHDAHNDDAGDNAQKPAQ